MFSFLDLFMHVLILELISFYNLSNYQYFLFCPTCNFLSAYLCAKHALVYICCLNIVYRMKFALHAALATNLLLCKFDRLESNIVIADIFNRHCLIRLHMNLHYSKFVVFMAFAFWSCKCIANMIFHPVVLNLLHYSWNQSLCLYQ